MQHYDYVIAGAGAAGLSLAWQLLNSELRHQRILLIDPALKNKNDRTWCFWETELPQSLQAVPVTQWENLRFIGSGFDQTFKLDPFCYTMVRGIDFYQAKLAEMAQFENVRFMQAAVTKVIDTPHGVVVMDEDFEVRTDWFFDSRPPSLSAHHSPYRHLKQHFVGWVIQTEADVFDPALPTLFDFRTPQAGAMRFFYVIPFSKRQALVEYTLFSEELLTEQAYADAIRAYLQTELGLESYTVVESESGVIPMTDQPLPRQLGERWMAIGTRGGRVKPSSGYAFLRILRDSAAIVESLQRHGHPFDLPEPPARYALFDAIMLEVMRSHPDQMADIFTALFRKNPIQRIFHFLDEKNSLGQDLRLIASLPWGPFLGALWRVKTGK